MRTHSRAAYDSAHVTLRVRDPSSLIAKPMHPATHGSCRQPTANAETLSEFIQSLRLPLQEPLITCAPCLRVSRRNDCDLVPRRSDRLAAKSAFGDPKPENQANRVLVNKWQRRPDNAPHMTPDPTIAMRSHETYAEPLSSKRAAMRVRFPKAGARKGRVLLVSD